MSKQTITTEIDCPEGYEFVRLEPSMRHGNTYYLPIFRKKWQWPEWLKAPWIAMDRNGSWYAYDEKPNLWPVGFLGGICCNITAGNLYDFTPPPCDDWKQSKRRNPNLDNNDA